MSKILDMNSYDDEDNFIPESKAINKAINENNIGLIFLIQNKIIHILLLILLVKVLVQF